MSALPVNGGGNPYMGMGGGSRQWAVVSEIQRQYVITSYSIHYTKLYEVDGDGHLAGGHAAPPPLAGARPGTRYHLVVTIPWNTTLAHIYLDPSLPFRNRIIADIVERSARFDGVQLDFESIAKEDGTAYLNS